MEIKQLQEEVEVALDEIVAMPKNGKFRCHEVARLLKKSLNRKGHVVVVRDGIVQYDGNFLVELFKKSLGLDEEFGEQESKSRYGRTRRIAHSWCELDDVIIDHQTIVSVPPNTILEHVTIVKNKGELEGKVDYRPVGIEFTLLSKSYLYIPFYVTRLRI